MSDNFEQLQREQIKLRREQADMLDKGGPHAKATAKRYRELADRMERQLDEAGDDEIQPLHQWRPVEE